MKKSVLFLLTLCLTVTVMGQDTKESGQQKEIGILFSDFESFGLTYKFGTSKSMFRIKTILLSGSINESNSFNSEIINENLRFKLGFGKEFRSDISKKAELRYGADVLFEYSKYESKTKNETSGNNYFLDKQIYYGPGVNLIIGFNYSISKKIFFGAEILPYITYLTGTKTEKTYPDFISTESDLSRLKYGLSNTSIMLSLTYRLK